MRGGVAHGFTVLVMKRSILTEKVSRRGFHFSREYAVDPLETIFVKEVMRTDVAKFPSHEPVSIKTALQPTPGFRQHLFPVVGQDGNV